MPGVLHDPRTIHVPTLDEALALALALSMCPPGESVSLHEANCLVTPEHPDACTCDARVYLPSPKADA